MSLQGNGKLLVRIGASLANLPAAAAAIAAPPAAGPAAFLGYSFTPLFNAPATLAPPHAKAAAAGFLSAESPGLEQRWQLATPPAAAKLPPNPWDQAHALAAAQNYQHYVEPDIVHPRRVPAEPLALVAAPLAPPAAPAAGATLTATAGFKDKWPPTVAGVGPAWHLKLGFADFEAARAMATGTGVTIGHLDTGYRPHATTPRNISPLAYDFWADTPGAYDPGTTGLGLFPGHGTATLALLAGNKVTLNLQTPTGLETYTGDFGGAPDAEILPVRVCPSVVELYTSSLAKGLDYALAHGCQVISLSHGGLPSQAWAAAVNRLYEAGVVFVAASGDSFNYKVIILATRFTVYPSAFNRVITALGATYDKGPYITDDFGEMQGCWGPDIVMDKAIAAYTPNVAWMEMIGGQFDMQGGGTSASTPQIAAACALWVELYGADYADDWTRVEACRLALFKSADDNAQDRPHLGWGVLNVPAMLDPALAQSIQDQVEKGAVTMRPVDSASFALWHLISGQGPAGSEQDRMYETEVAQLALSTTNAALLDFAQRAIQGPSLSPDEVEQARHMLLAEQPSQALTAALQAA